VLLSCLCFCVHKRNKEKGDSNGGKKVHISANTSTIQEQWGAKKLQASSRGLQLPAGTQNESPNAKTSTNACGNHHRIRLPKLDAHNNQAQNHGNHHRIRLPKLKMQASFRFKKLKFQTDTHTLQIEEPYWWPQIQEHNNNKKIYKNRGKRHSKQSHPSAVAVSATTVVAIGVDTAAGLPHGFGEFARMTKEQQQYGIEALRRYDEMQS